MGEGEQQEAVTQGRDVGESTRDSDTLRLVTEVIKAHSGRDAYFWGTVMGIGVGALFCLAGLAMGILGLSGSIEWVFEASGIRSRLTNAAPGAFTVLLGAIILWRYKPVVADSYTVGIPDASHRGVSGSPRASVLSGLGSLRDRAETGLRDGSISPLGIYFHGDHKK